MSKLLLDFGFSNTKNWKRSERLRFTTVLFVYSSGLPKDKAITGSYYVLKQIVKVPFIENPFLFSFQEKTTPGRQKTAGRNSRVFSAFTTKIGSEAFFCNKKPPHFFTIPSLVFSRVLLFAFF